MKAISIVKVQKVKTTVAIGGYCLGGVLA